MANDEPTVNVPAVTFNEPLSISRDSSLEDHIDADLALANSVVKAIYYSWSNVNSISQVCKLSQATFDALERRRHLANKQYAAPRQIAKGDVIYPLS